MGANRTITLAAFQARCLDLLERVEAGEVSRMEVTQRGRVVAVMAPAPACAAPAKELNGACAGACWRRHMWT